MSAAPPPPPAVQTPEQLLYARWLEWGTRLGLASLAVLFVVYVSGVITPHVPLEQLPSVWNLPVEDFLKATSMPSGWQWLGLAGHGDVAMLAGIVILAGCSVPCLLALVPGALRRGDRALAFVALAEVAVIVLAASGVLTAGH